MTDVLDSEPTSGPTSGDAPTGHDTGIDTPMMPGDTEFTVHLRWFVALSSVASGLWHVIYAFPHIDHHVLLGQSFLALGVLQIAWAAWLLRAPSRPLLLAGVAASAASLVMWVFAHSTGISWFPGLETAETIGWGDTVTKWFEWFVILGGLALLAPASTHRPSADGKANATVVAIMVVAIAGILGINYVGAYSLEHAEHGDHTHGPAEADNSTDTTVHEH